MLATTLMDPLPLAARQSRLVLHACALEHLRVISGPSLKYVNGTESLAFKLESIRSQIMRGLFFVHDGYSSI